MYTAEGYNGGVSGVLEPNESGVDCDSSMMEIIRNVRCELLDKPLSGGRKPPRYTRLGGLTPPAQGFVQ